MINPILFYINIAIVTFVFKYNNRESSILYKIYNKLIMNIKK
jgi:hypothetical protein